MADGRLVFNGLDGATGKYLTPALSADQIVAVIRGEPVNEDHQVELKRRYSRDTQATFGAIEGVDPKDVASAGWGVVFAHNAPAGVHDALAPLLAHRREQAGRLKEGRYKEYAGAAGYRAGDPRESKQAFLTRGGAAVGMPADPDRVPYYLLLVGDPESIPYSFQYQLDVEYAVGRLWFETPGGAPDLDAFARYARSVVDAETGKVALPRTAAFVGPRNDGDAATQLSADDLVRPLAELVAQERAGWTVRTAVGDGASKKDLAGLLNGPAVPALLFTASHGMGFPAGDPRQLPHQGALVCQDWPGPDAWDGPIKPDHYLAADDVADSAKLHGLLAVHFACYGAGTPRLDDFAHLRRVAARDAIAPRAFVGRLPQRLLGHPNGGALAVVGHVERAWSCSFHGGFQLGRQLQVFQSMLLRLLDGSPVGWAMEYFNQLYAALSTQLSATLEDLRYGAKPDEWALAATWTANNDARSYLVFGDPAVCLPAARDGAGEGPVKYAELQIGLHQWGADEFEVEFTYSDSSGPGEQRLAGDAPRKAAFDPAALRPLLSRPREYGKALSAALFADPAAAAFFAQAAQAAAGLRDPDDSDDQPGCPLQVRLHIGRRVTALHDLWWETLCDPRDGEFLTTKETIVFSRYLSSPYYRPLPARKPGDKLRVVLAVADPEDSAAWGLTRFDAAAETARARAALGPETYAVTELAGPGKATLDAVAAAAGEGCDILYLVCHGKLVGGAPWLWLVNPDNTTARTAGIALVTRMMELLHQPQLVVLASCQSGGVGGGEPRADDNGALAGLGPRLAEAGVPAVLAMQGNVTVATAGTFLPAFFRSLARNSAVDVAAAAARRQQAVRDRDDFWMPVLFTRLQSGRIWSPHGLEAAGDDFRPWDSFLTHLEKGEATVVLGFGVLEPLVGTREEVAGQWAQRYEYPLAPSGREDLTQVAQYLAVNENINFPGDELTRQLRRELLCRFDAGRRKELEKLSLNELLREARPLYRDEKGPTGGLDPFEVLARLPFRAYVNANGDDLLPTALAEPGADGRARPPQVRWFDWQGVTSDGSVEPVEVEKPPPGKPFVLAAGVGRPPLDRPLVYYLFGHFDDPRSLALTEDHYIDHLISLTLNREQLPKVLTSALVDSALLFIGFRFDDWSFRVLFRTILRLQGSDRLRNYTNVAVQIDPERDRIADPRMARRYLKEYFGKSGAQINVYWGSVPRFLKDLRDRWDQRRKQG